MKKVISLVVLCLVSLTSGTIVDHDYTLLSFSLKRATLNASPSKSVRTSELPAKIVSGSGSNETVYDTTQVITDCEMIRKNILELYQQAYDGISLFKFLYEEDLNYIASNALQDTYNCHMVISDLYGDKNSVMQKQLDMAFALKTKLVTRDTTIYVLKEITPSDRIRPVEPDGPFHISSNISSDSFGISGTAQIASLINMLETSLEAPVIYDETVNKIYKFSLVIEKEVGDQSPEAWIKALKEKGIYLSKEKRKTEYVLIEKEK